MKQNNQLSTVSQTEFRRAPWLLFLFMGAVFFIWEHDINWSKKILVTVDPSYDELVARVGEGSLIRRIALLSFGLAAIVSMIRQKNKNRLQMHGALAWIFLAFMIWALISPLWAEDLRLTLRRLAAFGIFCFAATAIARRFSLREAVLWTVSTTGVFLIIGVWVEVLLGTFRPFALGYRFCGTLDPNNQGVNCALLLLSGVAAADLENHRKLLFRACALSGLCFLLLTASRTSFAAALISLYAYLALVCSWRKKMAMVYGVVLISCVLSFALGDTVLAKMESAAMLGRGDTDLDSFHGRSGIWDDVSRYIDQRPILGYGYGGFWTPNHISEISDEEKWGVPNGHSAYLDYLLTLGGVGLIAYSLLLLGGIRRAIRFHSRSRNPVLAFFLAVLIFCSVDGFLESGVISPSLLMFLCLVILASLAFVNYSHADVNSDRLLKSSRIL